MSAAQQQTHGLDPDGWYDILMGSGALLERVHVLAIDEADGTAEAEVRLSNGRWQQTWFRLAGIADAEQVWVSAEDARGSRRKCLLCGDRYTPGVDGGSDVCAPCVADEIEVRA